MKVLISNSVYVIIKSFIEKLTVDQWKALTSAAPTNVTNILVAEMTLNIIDTVTESMRSNVGSLRLKYVEDAVPGLEYLLQHSFCEALHMKQADESLKSLTKMIQQENQENLNSLNARPEHSEINWHITSPSRLNRMVCCVNELLSKVGVKARTIFQPSKKGDEHGQEDGLKQGEEDEVAPEEETVDKPVTQDSIQEIIRKELSDISTHLMEDVPGDEVKGLEFVSSEEIESMGKEVSLLVSTEEERKHSFKGLKKQLKLVFAKCFLRVWLRRLLAQLKKKHREDITVGSCESIVDQLTPQLLSDLNRQDENSTPVKVKSKYITGDKVSVLFQRLAPLLYRRSSRTITPNSSLKGPDNLNKLIPQDKSEIYNDLRRKSWICTVLMKWFLKTVVKGLGAGLKHSILKEKPGSTIMEVAVFDFEPTEAAELSKPPSETGISVPTESVGRSVILETEGTREDQQHEPMSVEDATSEHAEQQESPDLEREIKMSYVQTFIEKVVFHVCVDAHVLFGNKYNVNNGILEKVWAEVKNDNIYITSQTFKDLDWEIHQTLCHRFKPLELLYLMTLQDPVVMEICISLVRKRLTKPPPKNPVRRFFSSVAKFLSKSFR